MKLCIGIKRLFFKGKHKSLNIKGGIFMDPIYAYCSKCGAKLPSPGQPCPVCGGGARTLSSEPVNSDGASCPDVGYVSVGDIRTRPLSYFKTGKGSGDSLENTIPEEILQEKAEIFFKDIIAGESSPEDAWKYRAVLSDIILYLTHTNVRHEIALNFYNLYRGYFRYIYASWKSSCYDGGCGGTSVSSMEYEVTIIPEEKCKSILNNSDFSKLDKESYNVYGYSGNLHIDNTPIAFIDDWPCRFILIHPLGIPCSVMIKHYYSD